MVQFEARMDRERHDPWGSKYLDYALLKRRIKDASSYTDDGRKELVAALTNVFQGLFDNEVEKVLRFYQEKCADIQKEADKVQATASRVGAEEHDDSSDNAADQASTIEEAFSLIQRTTQDITNLLSFVSLNMAAVRKILKKAAKKLPTKSTYGAGLLTLRIEHPHQDGWKILQGTFLPLQTGEELEAMRAHVLLIRIGTQMHTAFEDLQRKYRGLTRSFPDLQPQTRSLQQRSSLRRLSMSLSFKYTPHPGSNRPSQSEDTQEAPSVDDIMMDLEGQLARMGQAEKLSRTQAGLVHAHNYQQSLAGIFEEAPSDDGALADSWGLYLNCINSGLYMANYNVVIPTITNLCSHIGVSNSYSGLIIGACDVATVVSTIGYSMWTDRSYKHPLLASAVACILGNVAYCASYDTKSIFLLLGGRLITGFGSARAVNRRYIAMFVARDERTWASALFVSLSAVGMALGPLLALPLARAPSTKLLGLTFGPITLGGWSMSAAWIVFIVVSMIFFRDPIIELKQREAKQSKDESDDSASKPLLEQDREDDSDQQDSSHDPEDGSQGTSKANGVSYDPKVHKSMNAVTLESDHDFPMTAGLKRVLDSPAMATACCIFLCFILKTVQQAYIDGLPVFTESQYAYGWSDGTCGIMLGVLGLSAPVINQLVAKGSTKISDRAITVGSILVTGAGGVLLMAGPYPLWSFFAGGVAIYYGTIVLEGVSMSLVSKVIDERMSKGFWNAGLLSTQAGTTGRLSGNLLLSICARIGTESGSQLRQLAASMFGTSVGFMAFSLVWVMLVYRRLVG